MPIFELDKDELLDLTDGQLEELVARLSEAEVAKAGHASSSVRWMGALTAADGGIDVQVIVPNSSYSGDFVPRAETVFQVKKPSMPPAKISEEMTGKENAKKLFDSLHAAQAAFVIVSLGDNTAPPNYQARVDKMKDELSALVGKSNVSVDFYDRSRLAQWLRQHVSVQFWVRKVLGESLSCWRPLEKWTATPAGADDSVIFQKGITLGVPGQIPELSLEEAIPATRELIRTTSKAIRVAGLSGVGKTRFVQALFENVGADDPLDKTRVVYADIGEGPDPSATNLLDTLIAEQRSATLVLDNCPTDLHGILAARLSNKSSDIKLITVEYDIREDKPQTTEVIRIRAQGPEIAEQLVARRFPDLAGPNARRIAEFAEGNCRLAIALADAVPTGDSLVDLSDDQLFQRLFYQRHDLDKDIKEQAEALALVYSFSVDPEEEGIDELAVLGHLCEKSRQRMHRAAQTLVERQIAQQRGRWRAVLPHAIANRLAADALRNIPDVELVEIFEANAGPRLLKSFGRRLGFLHDHEVARKIVERWLRDDGLLNKIVDLDEHGAEMLMHVAPVAPEYVLQMIETQIVEIVPALASKNYHPRRTTILTLLTKIAYDPELFERSMHLLVVFAIAEDTNKSNEDVRSRIRSFFTLLLSGTQAGLDERFAFVEQCLNHNDQNVVEIGLSLISETLRTEHFSGPDNSDFGARPRDFGWEPTYEESVRWLKEFLGLVKALASTGNERKKRVARSVLAERFRELWRITDLRNVILDLGRELNAEAPWLEGWRAVRSILHFDRITKKKEKLTKDVRALLEELENELSPTDLEGRIRALVLGAGQKIWSLDDEFDPDELDKYEESRARLAQQAFELGRDCHAVEGLLDRVAGELFEPGYTPYKSDFGRGLIAGSANARSTWDQLVTKLKSQNVENFGFGVLIGALQEISESERSMATKILDECAEDDLLKSCVVALHPVEGFEEADFDRCLSVLKQTGLPLMGIGDLLWRPQYDKVSDEKRIALSELILAAAGGPNELLDAYAMRLHGKAKGTDVLGSQQRRLGLMAATAAISRSASDPGGSKDYNMQQVLRNCLKFDGNNDEKTALMNGLFERVANSHGYLSDLEGAIQVIAEFLPDAFLSRALLDTSIDEYKRFGLFRNSVREISLLAGISSEQLVQWCQKVELPKGEDLLDKVVSYFSEKLGGKPNHGHQMAEKPERWCLIARAMSPFDKASSGEFSLTEKAIALLENSPQPSLVLDGFLQDLSPSSWSGSRADQVSKRAAAFKPLLGHGSREIGKATTQFLEKAKVIEDQERSLEAQRHDGQEQRFE